jgi:hypothetical protein
VLLPPQLRLVASAYAPQVVCAGQQYVFASFWDRKRTLAALQAAWLKSGSPYAPLYLAGTPPDASSPGAAVPQRSEAVHAAEQREEAQAPQPPAAKPQAERAALRTEAADGGGATQHVDQEPAHLDGLLAAARQSPEPLLSPPSPIVSSAAASIPDVLPASCALGEPSPPPADGVLLPVARDGTATEALLDCSPGEFFALFLQDGSRFTEAFRCARGEADVQVCCCVHSAACVLAAPLRATQHSVVHCGCVCACVRVVYGRGCKQVSPWGGDSSDDACCARVVNFRAPLDSMKGFRVPGIPKSTRIREEQRCAAGCRLASMQVLGICSVLTNVRLRIACAPPAAQKKARRSTNAPRAVSRASSCWSPRPRSWTFPTVRARVCMHGAAMCALLWHHTANHADALRTHTDAAGDSFVLDARLELRCVQPSPPRCRASVLFRVRWLRPLWLASIRNTIESQSRTSTAEAFRMCAHTYACPV